MNTYLDLKSVTKNIARVIICYDALLQIRANKIVAMPGTYFYVPSDDSKDQLNPSQQVDKILETNLCEACALGTLFAARAKVFNKIKIEDVDLESGTIDVSLMIEQLENYFDKDQLSLIETCFEGNTGGFCGADINNDVSLYKAARLFYKKYKTSESRLIAILKNIIKNSGTFIPQQNITRKRK